MMHTFRPLQPGSWGQPTPASQRRSRFTFKAPWSDTLNLLEYELTSLGAKDCVIEADFREQDLRLDGLPRANARRPEFPGIRLSFESKHGPLQYQTDAYDGWHENVRAIALGLKALRAVDRYGITSRAEQYTGFKAIEAPGKSFNSAEARAAVYRIAGVNRAVGLGPAWRRARANAHPDATGDRTLWDELEQYGKVLNLL